MRTVCPLKAFRLKVLKVYPVVSFKLEKVPRVASTWLLELRTWICNRSKTVVVVVSALEILSQKLSVTVLAFDGIVMVWKSVSVCVTP